MDEVTAILDCGTIGCMFYALTGRKGPTTVERACLTSSNDSARQRYGMPSCLSLRF